MPSPISATSSTAEQSIPTGRLKPLVSLLSHKWLALFIIIVVTAMGIPVASKMEKTVYNTTAVLLVSHKFIPTLDSEKGMNLGRGDYQFYLKQQKNLIQRDDVLQEAMQVPEVRRNWLRPQERDRQGQIRLKRAISVKTKRGNPFMTVKLTSNKPKGLDIVLDAVVKLYLKKSQEENIFDSSGRVKKLKQLQTKLQDSIAKKRELRTKIALELGVTTFQENSSNPYDALLIESTKAHTLAHRQTVKAETNFATLTKKLGNEQTTLDIFVDEMVANDSVLKAFKTKLTDRRTELLTQTLGLTPKHPSRQRAELEIAKIDQDIKQATDKLSGETRNRLLKKSQAEISKAQSIEQALADELAKQRNNANHYATLYNKALLLNQKINRASQQLNKMNNRIDFLNIEATAPGFVRVDTPASKPHSSTKFKPKQIILMFIVAALGLGITVPILIDMLDKRIRTTGEVHKNLGFAPMAWILDLSDNGTEQLTTDQLRRLALALERDWHTHDTTSFVLTSVKSGGGTTTLTLGLAHILNELGVRTLAVELNAFKPDDRYCDADSSEGLTTLLSQDDFQSLPLEMLIVPATTTLPDRLPVGKTSKPYITTHGKLRSLIKQLKAHYDLILLDTPPLLLSADAELLGKIVGGVLLIVEAEVTMPGELKRAAHLLERLDPPVVGAILNRVKVFRGGGYFTELLKEYETRAKLRPGLIQRLLWH